MNVRIESQKINYKGLNVYEKLNDNEFSEIIEGSFTLIDLAGSERLNESKAENERLKEIQFINKSLSSLGRLFTAIKRKDKHISFRDSKLNTSTSRLSFRKI